MKWYYSIGTEVREGYALFSFYLRENYSAYYEKKIICWCGSGTDQVRNLYSEERSAIEHIVGAGTDQGRNLYSEKRVGEICIFFYFLRVLYISYYER